MNNSNWFDQHMTSSEEAQKAEQESQAKVDVFKELTSRIHEVGRKAEDKEPDWDGMLLRAKSQQEKWKIREAKETYELDRKVKVWEAQQKDFNDEVNKILAMPSHTRNKEFYDDLLKTKGRFFFDNRIAQQRRLDQQALGLAYHLKKRG